MLCPYLYLHILIYTAVNLFLFNLFVLTYLLQNVPPWDKYFWIYFLMCSNDGSRQSTLI